MEFEQCSLRCDTPTSPPRYDSLLPSVKVLIWYQQETDSASMMLIDQNRGASVTNAAPTLLAFLLRHHVGRRDYPWASLTTVYRDSAGRWDRLLISDYASGTNLTVSIEPISDGTLEQALKVLAEAGLHLGPHTEAQIRSAISEEETV